MARAVSASTRASSARVHAPLVDVERGVVVVAEELRAHAESRAHGEDDQLADARLRQLDAPKNRLAAPEPEHLHVDRARAFPAENEVRHAHADAGKIEDRGRGLGTPPGLRALDVLQEIANVVGKMREWIVRDARRRDPCVVGRRETEREGRSLLPPTQIGDERPIVELAERRQEETEANAVLGDGLEHGEGTVHDDAIAIGDWLGREKELSKLQLCEERAKRTRARRPNLARDAHRGEKHCLRAPDLECANELGGAERRRGLEHVLGGEIGEERPIDRRRSEPALGRDLRDQRVAIEAALATRARGPHEEVLAKRRGLDGGLGLEDARVERELPQPENDLSLLRATVLAGGGVPREEDVLAARADHRPRGLEHRRGHGVRVGQERGAPRTEDEIGARAPGVDEISGKHRALDGARW